ncbi:hypothetical protein Hanom_Chr17g01578621 [Helianthus anomalus]
MDWQGAPASPGVPSAYTVKRILRLEIPVATYPNGKFAKTGRWYNTLFGVYRRNRVDQGSRANNFIPLRFFFFK